MQELKLKEEVTASPYIKDIYRRLRTNIEFTGVENKVIAVTSCEAADGKSTISYNLARIFAESDKKVLYIDADMRNSHNYNRLGYNKEIKGLSHYLSGKENMTEVMYTTNYRKLVILPTGVFPKNPTELLGKQRFANLITASKNAFDYVIIDTPPLGAVVDAAVVAKECDGSILVIPSDKISRRTAKNVKEQLVQANPNLLGVVLNQVDAKATGYGKKYGYGYGYGYRYGYGYGENEEKKKQ